LIPDISVNPTSHNFGNVTVGDSSAIKTLTVSNTGNGDLDIEQISLGSGDFTISSDNCSNTIVAPDANCTVKVTFVPQTEGAKNATLSIPSNDPNTATATVTLTGNGIVLLIPDISVNPTSHNFGNVTVGDSSAIKTLTVSNTGNGELEIGQISLGDEDFSISTDNCSNTTVAADANCTVIVTFAPLSTGVKNATLLIPSNMPDTFTVTLQGEGIEVSTDTPTPASCQLYAVNDKGLNNSQFFTISLPDLNVSQLGSTCDGCDIEALAIHPKTNIIYAASGDDATNGKKGYLYTVDGETGELTSVGSTGFNEIEGLAFSADGNTLWAWAKGDGMITIDTITGIGTLVMSAHDLVEDLALSSDIGTVFYAAIGTELWVYDVPADKLNICTNLPGETEALERLPDGLVLIGTHKNKTLSLQVLNPTTCQVIVEKDILVAPFNDVEGIALPIGACSP
jgi:carbonic anhydrase/acetyltransferase-like protein (isoleucine patch superfamily)